MTITADYFVDGTVDAYTASRTGSSGSPWTGAGGIQQALSLATAGQVIAVKGDGSTSLTCSKLKKITVGSFTDGGAPIAAGDFVIESSTSGGNPNGAQGHVVWRQSATVLWIYVSAGTWVTSGSPNNYIYKSSGNYAGAISAIATLGLTVMTAGSAAAGRSKLIGVNSSSWNDDGTTFVVSGNGCTNGLVANASFMDYRNFAITGTSGGHGILFNSANTDCVLVNVLVQSSSGNGFSAIGNRFLFRRCRALSNTGIGFYPGSSASAYTLFGCESQLNATGVSMASSSAQVQDCIIANNSGAGLVYSGNGQVAVDGCVFDGNGTDHINISAGSSSIIRQSRFSYCGSGYYAINMSAATNARVIEDYNVFFANGGDTGATDTHDRLSVDVGANSIHVDSDDALGYTLRSSGNYNLTNAATLQSVSSSFDATNVLAMCAGLVPLTDYPTVDNVKSGVAFNRGLQGTYAAAGGISRARLVGGE